MLTPTHITQIRAPVVRIAEQPGRTARRRSVKLKQLPSQEAIAK
jgi:hypothetical protein